MPPKLFLNVNASVRESFAPAAAAAAAADDDAGRGAIAALHAPSIEIGPSGTLKLFKSFQAFEFNPLGMKRSAAETAPLASGAAALQSSYKVRPAVLPLGLEMCCAARCWHALQVCRILLPAACSNHHPALCGSRPCTDLGARCADRAHAGQRRQRRGTEGLPATGVALRGGQCRRSSGLVAMCACQRPGPMMLVFALRL